MFLIQDFSINQLKVKTYRYTLNEEIHLSNRFKCLYLKRAIYTVGAQEIFFYFVNLQVKLSVRCTQRIYNEPYSEFVNEILFILI